MGENFKVEGFAVYPRSQSSGTYRIQLERGVIRSWSLKTKSKDLASERAEALIGEYFRRKSQKLQLTQKTPLGKWIEIYKERRHRQKKSTKTINLDTTALKSLMNILGGSIPIQAIGQKEIEKFVAVCEGNGAKPTSINSYLRHIQSSLNDAKRLGYRHERISIEKLKTRKMLPRILTKRERTALLAYAKKHDQDIYRIILFALYTGCRMAEIQSARWENYDDGWLTIIGKGDKQRIVPIVKKAATSMGAPRKTGPIFPQWHLDTYTHRFKSVCTGCKQISNEIHFHSLRNSAATEMLESGIPLDTIQRILGHADIQTTQIYAQVRDKLMKKQMEGFSYDN